MKFANIYLGEVDTRFDINPIQISIFLFLRMWYNKVSTVFIPPGEVKQMELSHLKQFLVLAKTENMREAAEILYMSQPNLSRNLKALEAELGYPLFDRNKQRLTLNKNGKEVLACAQRIFNEIEKMHRIHLRDTERIPLNFVGNGAVYYDILIPMLMTELPWYEIHCHTFGSSEEKLRAMSELEDTIVFCTQQEAASFGPEFDGKYLFTDRLCLSVPDKYALAHRNSIHLDELEDALKGLPVILSNHIESNLSNSLIRKHNIRITPSYVVNQPLNSRQLINNDGIVFDAMLLSYFPMTNSRKFVPIEGDATQFDVYIYYRKTDQSYTNTAIEWLLDFFREMYK